MSDFDLTFITNENDESLLKRFNVLIKDCKTFDALVGYFFISGFYLLYPALENTEKIRILIGLKTDRKVYDLLNEAKQSEMDFISHAEAKKQAPERILRELESSEDSQKVEEGIIKFVEWIKSGKLEIRAYKEKLHAKVYIMSFNEGDRDKGRVITGSSNFSRSGLKDNLEFNVELKNRSDFEFAKEKFNKLWEESVDVSEIYVETIKNESQYAEFTPYELYLKFLYEHFKQELNIGALNEFDLPADFKKLQYQEDAVMQAKRILEEYNGVFLSDVVGLGKTYMAAMLAQVLKGRNLIIAPPALLDRNNYGSWPNVFEDFQIRQSRFESIGKLDQLMKLDLSKYENVFIDEAHRFRTDDTLGYEKLHEICSGKKVILVTATPLNNSPKDIFSQLKLFQKARNSDFPNLPNIESFFNSMQEKLKKLDRKKDRELYLKTVKENSKNIRERVLKYVMIRRTRNEITNNYAKDLEKQNLCFPEVADPVSFYYQFNEYENKVFEETLRYFKTDFKFSRYTPLLYLKNSLTQPQELAQKNMGKFMKTLLIKRLESSFFAFKKTIGRFIWSYEKFLEHFEKGNVYISKKYVNKIFEILDNNDVDVDLEQFLQDKEAEIYRSEDFEDDFENDLKEDLRILKIIHENWKKIERDPKWLSLSESLKKEKLFKDNKLIIFTESKETAEYLGENLRESGENVFVFTGASGEKEREIVIENFDANYKHKKDDYRILITTETLSEGVNLHRSNIVINYDIPWNPTKLIQRVGRVNRVNTKFDKIYTFNFFPTEEANDEIKLKEAAEAKIEAFIEMLGNDAKLLTDSEDVISHNFMNNLNSKFTFTGEGDEVLSELPYLNIIKEIRDKQPEVFEKLKKMPKKARSGKSKKEFKENKTLTYFRKGALEKFYISSLKSDSEEIDFFGAVNILQAEEKEVRQGIGRDFYEMLERNKKAFTEAEIEDTQETFIPKGRDSSREILKRLKILKIFKSFTEEDEEFVKKVSLLIEQGGLPKNILKKLSANLKDQSNEFKMLEVFKTCISENYLKDDKKEEEKKKRRGEVILSEYLTC